MKELTKTWNNLEKFEKLEIIENGIDMANTDEGFLHLRYYRDGSIYATIQTKLDNHLCTEAVSQITLFELFGEGHDFIEEDAETILNWMESQN